MVRTHLGDGVYVFWDGDFLQLQAQNGAITNRIRLSVDAWAALVKWTHQLGMADPERNNQGMQ